MKKKDEQLLFTTIEDAMNFGLNGSYGEFDFSELYDLINSKTTEIVKLKNKITKLEQNLRHLGAIK